ncbi:hypothetical protein [Leifsonia shinshuensis]|uniref:hypothetical protein n=1 Tax=Leifsonia shinshuensis TaxID=150026 RepID=UPI00286129E0|nr:hypothetical protein [Leifsonia shinshuensis]MDR6970937.1 hypothetical protein [Leifsonia shinshuensis]
MGIRPTRRKLLGAGAATLAAAALAIGVAGPASAATSINGGTTTGGIGALSVTPSAPATDFSQPGTLGTLSFRPYDVASPGGRVDFVVGDTQTWRITLPAGIEFGATACDWRNQPGAFFDMSCTLSPDRKVWTHSYRYKVDTPGSNFSPGASTEAARTNLPVVTTGPLSGKVLGTYTAYAGLSNGAPSASFSFDAPGPVENLNATGPDGTGEYTLEGTGEAGATVTITDDNGALWTTPVDPDGTWKRKLPTTVKPPLTITQTLDGLTSTPVTYDTEPLPIMNPAVALGVLALAGAVVGGTVLARRRRAATATAAV